MDEAKQVLDDTMMDITNRNITDWPFIKSSFITWDTDFSFPGIGLELKIMVSFGFIFRLQCGPRAADYKRSLQVQQESCGGGQEHGLKSPVCTTIPAGE